MEKTGRVSLGRLTGPESRDKKTLEGEGGSHGYNVDRWSPAVPEKRDLAPGLNPHYTDGAPDIPDQNDRHGILAAMKTVPMRPPHSPLISSTGFPCFYDVIICRQVTCGAGGGVTRVQKFCNPDSPVQKS